MISVTKKYIEACESPIRSSYVVVKYGLFDKEAKTTITAVVSTSQPFSNPSQTYDEIKDTNYNYITCEPNRVVLDNTFAFINDKTTINRNQNIGIWSQEISDENGMLATPFDITYTFGKLVKYTPLTLTFEEIVSSLDIMYYLDDELKHTKSISNNEELIIKTEDENSSDLLFSFNKLVISIKSTKEPNRFVKFNELDLGIYETFKKEDINNLEIIDEISIDSSSMVSNSCSLTINDKDGKYDIVNPYNKLKTLQEKQELTVYHYLKVGNNFKEVPLGTFLIKDMNYRDKKMTLQCYDDRYFMNKTYYGSKFYINAKVKNVLEDLFIYFNYDVNKYVIDSELDNDVISGYIPFVSFGEALRLICESVCAIVSKTRYGITYIYKTYDDNVIKTFKTNSYDKSNPTKNLYNSIIDIDEYNYKESSSKVVLYNGTLKKGTHFIQFEKAPIVYKSYSSDFSLLKVDSSNTNFNIISLYASGCEVEVLVDDTTIELSGNVYETSVSTKRIKKYDYLSVDDYAIGKVSNHLINSTNSNNVALWKLNRGEIKYSFDVNSMPYIEVGDTCKIQLPYKTINNTQIVREFVPTKLRFNLGIKETIEGE